MSELIRWFQKRREKHAFDMVERHLAITTGISEDLEKAIQAAVRNGEAEMRKHTDRVSASEKEADRLRRLVMDEISKGELPPTDREGLLELVKRLDMVADWNRESTRILGAFSMKEVPDSLKQVLVEIVTAVKQCTLFVQRCVTKMMTKPEEALQAADIVERQEESVDDIHEKARNLIGKEDLPRAGVAVLISQLFEAIEMIADSCEDVSDQVRVIIVRQEI